MRKSLLVLGAAVVLGTAGYGYYRYKQRPLPPAIASAQVTRGDLAETVGATGTLQAVTTVQVGTQVSGTILELNADFNSLVRKGQVLARLDPALFQAQIEQARANLIRAEADLERLKVALDDARAKLQRAKELAGKRLIAQTELEAADVAARSAEAQLRSQEAAVTQSRASLRQNEVNLQHTVITSPIDGLVISRNVDVGQTVAASMSAPTLFVLAADLTKMQVLASLDESDVGRIRPGQVVRFRVDAYPNDEFTGSLTQVRLQPTTVQNVVTYQTVIDVPNPELKLKPGMTATVSVEVAKRSNVLRVPNAALRFRPTTEIFAALGQTPPPMRGRGAGPGQDGAARGTSSRSSGERPLGQTPPATGTAAAQAGQQRPQGEGRMNSPTAAPQERASADGTGAAAGRGGRRGGRGNLLERLASLTPEEREQFRARMRARGFTPPTDEELAAGNASRGRGAGAGQATNAPTRTPQGQKPSTTQTAAPSGREPATFDALFAPLEAPESFGQVWLNVGGKLQRVRVRLGVSDGQQTELLQAFDGVIQEGTELVTNVTIGSRQTTATPAPAGSAFPGLDGGRGGFRGGRRGGGG